ncbi:MAG: glycosyltransferase family 4 protein, partial [Acidimicrobiia bacterium]
MRILLVSAHFPPNFVSGGTLAADRQARGLRERGHEVSVYAGWYGTDRRALETVDEVVDGLPIRWITTEPFTGWADRANFDNRPVARDFAAHVARLRPDVVHFHSLQGLGARLLDVAADAGAAVVVTMHDFWWHCARQFLVTKDFQPCSLVVDCGVCPCEKTHPWLEKRNAWLAERLARADMILAVSESAARVFAANGVDPLRMRVDENGLPGATPRTGGNSPPIGRAIASSSKGGRRVRFTYTGGSARMKGVHVLVEAARRLRDVPGWELTLFGCEDFLRDERVALNGMPVESRPAFAPDEAEAVFASTDVLIVPSVMRESHSLVTREALQRGVPVLVTDSLGPEEVVEHGVNGMVVPSGDPEALAAGIRRLVEDADLLGALRDGAASPVVVRDIGDQLDGLERLYREMVEHRSGGVHVARPRGARKVRRVLFVVGIDGAPLRYRARLPAEGLRTLGVRADVVHYRDPGVDRLAQQADAVVVYRVPATHQVLALLDDLRSRGIPLFFDVDDLIFDPGLAAEIPALEILPPDEAELWLEGVRRYRTTMEACDAFIGTTEMLLGHASAVVGLPTYRFANGVGRLIAQASDAA